MTGAQGLPAPALLVRDVIKRYPGTVALGGLDFEAYPGEVHALLGANGAGKSTMIKIMAGLTGYDSGTIELGGRPFDRATSSASIAFIHQDLGLIDELTVAENMAVTAGFERRFGLLDRRGTAARAAAALARIGADLDPYGTLGDFSRADKSLVAIARALAEPKSLIFFDEPTASLHEQEVGRLFEVVEVLRAAGAAIVYVTHRLDEVFRLATRVSVLRDGRRVLSRLTPETTSAEIVATIAGARRITERSASTRRAEVAVRAEEIRVGSGAHASFEVNRGEVVGVAGLQGAGHAAIGRALCGITDIVGGSLLIGGRPVHFDSPADAIDNGVVFVTSNRETEGIAYDMTSQENLFLNPPGRGLTSLKPKAKRQERLIANDLLTRYDVRPADPTRLIATLSGGNQQKIILARCLSLPSEVVVLEEPTMGVDVGGKSDIFAIIANAAAEGKGMLVISTDFEELVAICDRVLVFDRGTIVDELAGNRLDVSTLTSAASGGAA
jgi:ribose transport system ATP-binding protein